MNTIRSKGNRAMIRRSWFAVLMSSLLLASSAWGKVTTYFSPATNLERVDIQWLNKAAPVKRLYIAMYSFTDKRLARELIKLAQTGVVIDIYRDDKQMEDRTDITWMLKGVPGIHIKAKDDRGFWNIMHDKIFIIPGVVFREGSANWSPSAEGANSYDGHSGHDEQQDNNASYITNRTAIRAAITNFRHIWNRPSNIAVN